MKSFWWNSLTHSFMDSFDMTLLIPLQKDLSFMFLQDVDINHGLWGIWLFHISNCSLWKLRLIVCIVYQCQFRQYHLWCTYQKSPLPTGLFSKEPILGGGKWNSHIAHGLGKSQRLAQRNPKECGCRVGEVTCTQAYALNYLFVILLMLIIYFVLVG